MALRKEEFVYRFPKEEDPMVIIHQKDMPAGLRRLPMTETAFQTIRQFESPYTYLFFNDMVYEVGWVSPTAQREIEGMDGIPMTLEAYEALLNVDDPKNAHRYQMAGGVVYNMTAGSGKHFDIIGNIYTSLRRQVGKRGPCRVYSEAQVAIEEQPTTFPDIVMSCASEDQGSKQRDVSLRLRSPRLIVEVLSPGTQKFDRGEKFTIYQSIPSLEVYLLISQDEPLVEVYRRNTNWTAEYYREEQTLTLLTDPALTLTIDETYDGIW
jgi:Uma2 family endonuclease